MSTCSPVEHCQHRYATTPLSTDPSCSLYPFKSTPSSRINQTSITPTLMRYGKRSNERPIGKQERTKELLRIPSIYMSTHRRVSQQTLRCSGHSGGQVLWGSYVSSSDEMMIFGYWHISISAHVPSGGGWGVTSKECGFIDVYLFVKLFIANYPSVTRWKS